MKGTSFVFFGLVCLFAFILPFSAVSQTPDVSASPEIKKNEADLIHFGDLIDVDFAGGVEFDWRGQLTPEGMLDGLDEYSPIRALCRSEADVAADIAKAYGKILRDPKIIVKIIDRSNRAVARLEGAVKTPMRFRILRPVRLRELIVATGGFTDDASGEIVIFRPVNLNCTDTVPNAQDEAGSYTKPASGNGSQTISITIGELLTGKESADLLVLGGDLVTVGKAVPIYVIGAVNNPRPIYSHSGMTLSRAIATAGGLTKGAIPQNVTIYRRSGNDSSVIQVDLERIKTGEINDVDLKAFDIIDVAFKGRAQRKYPPMIATSDKEDRNTPDLPLRIIE